MSNVNVPVDLQGINLYLIGMMGAGKSTTGRLLAQALGYGFVDSDTVIEQVVGQPIPEIFAEMGESGFRAIETQVLSQLAAHTKLVVATGGGIVLERINWSHLQQGVVVWLDASIDTLWQRLKGDTQRPLLQDTNPKQKLEHLLAQRQRLYNQADIRIEVTSEHGPEQVVQHILMAVPSVIKAPSTATQ
jgi:shikimate kinase